MNRVILLLACMLGVMAWQSASADDILVERMTEPMPDRGQDMVHKSVHIKMPGAQLRYRGLGPAQGGRAISTKYGDHFLGLFFDGGAGGNGGWSRWQFLRVSIRRGDETFWAERHMLLQDAYVLEREDRRMVMLRWPLSETTAEQATVTTADEIPRLDVTLVQYPSMPDWLFLRVLVEADDAELAQVQLNSFPGGTSGPEERQRWVATGEQRLNLHKGPQNVSPDAPGLVFFNRFAQQQAGCFLVPMQDQSSAIQVRGTYGVSATFTANPKQHVHIYALGYFVDEMPEEAIRRFADEWQPAVLTFMQNIDWTPRFSWQEIEKAVSQIDELMADETGQTWLDQWRDLKQRFEAVQSQQAVTQAIDLSGAMSDFKERLLRARLDKLR